MCGLRWDGIAAVIFTSWLQAHPFLDKKIIYVAWTIVFFGIVVMAIFDEETKTFYYQEAN